MEHIYWYAAIGISFVLGALVFYKIGKLAGVREERSYQHSLAATKAWSETIERMMGGQHGGHN